MTSRMKRRKHKLNLKILSELTCFEHSKQVSKLSALLAQLAGYSAEEVSVIEQAALYHDIGKVSIPPEILNKPAQLKIGRAHV